MCLPAFIQVTQTIQLRNQLVNKMSLKQIILAIALTVFTAKSLKIDCLWDKEAKADAKKQKSFTEQHQQPLEGEYVGGCKLMLNFHEYEVKCSITVTKNSALTGTIAHFIKQWAKFCGEEHGFVKDYLVSAVTLVEPTRVENMYISDVALLAGKGLVTITIDDAEKVEVPDGGDFVFVGGSDDESDSFWKDEFKAYQQVEADDL